MKKRRKPLLVSLALFVLVIVGGVFVAGFLADAAVRKAVESAGAKTLGVDMDVAKADLRILRGTVNLGDITVANPPGYEGERLLGLDRGDIQIDTGSLLSDKVYVRQIKLDGMEVFVEQKGATQNNLYEVMEKVRRDHKPSGKKLIIDHLEITNIRVNVELLPVPGQTDRLTLKLAPIQMTNLGRDEEMDIPILLSKILLAVAAGLAEQGTDVLPKEMIGDLATIVDKAIDIGRIIFGNNSSDLKDGVQNVGEGLKNLIKPKDEP